MTVSDTEKLYEQAEAKGQLFRQLLVHPAIKAIRGKGLMLAVEFDSFAVLKPIIDQAILKGVITDWFLFCDNSMRIAPPLIITEAQIREACAVILEAIDASTVSSCLMVDKLSGASYFCPFWRSVNRRL